MTMANLRYAPEFRLSINDAPIPAALRASIASVSHQTGLEGADRVELSLVNENLRWLDHPLLALDSKLALSIGYAPDTLEQVFLGEIVGQAAAFPSGGSPTLTVTAQDFIHRLQPSTKVRWFAIPLPCVGNLPMPDPLVGDIVSLENGLIPIFDPIGAALAVLLGGVEMVAALGNPDEMQKVIRKQDGESDFDFLTRIAQANGWEMLIDHSGPQGGYQLRFLSPLSRLTPEVTLKYGHSLVDFTPRVSEVGQIAGVSVNLWRPEIKVGFTVTVSWDWDRQSLDVTIYPSFGLPGAPSGGPSITLVDEPVTLSSAPRVILSKLIPRLNQRLTGSGSTIGDARIRAGTVLRLEGLGEQFGGLYRVTSATHTIDGSGFRTGFEVRKEIWFGSIPPLEQGAVPVSVQGQRIA